MTKIFKQLARHWAVCLVVFALLFVQAYCDLSQYACTNSSANTTRQTAQCRASCLKIFVMVRFSLRVNVARGIFRKNGIHQRAAQRVHLGYLLRL